MNPILIFYIFLGGFILWALSSWLFPRIGEFVKTIVEYIKSITEEKEEQDRA